MVNEKGVKYLRYLKPLTQGPLCMTCHGPKENIPSEVQGILKEKYPEDRATGFLVGDLRGAISVKIALQNYKRGVLIPCLKGVLHADSIFFRCWIVPYLLLALRFQNLCGDRS